MPSAGQLQWHRDELAMFLHFGVNTFTNREWGDGTESPSIFNPMALDSAISSQSSSCSSI
jgi:alpha-L-fucosidase